MTVEISRDTPDTPDPSEKTRVRFVKEISLGNVITLVGMLTPMVIWAFSTHADVQAIKAELPRIEARQRRRRAPGSGVGGEQA